MTSRSSGWTTRALSEVTWPTLTTSTSARPSERRIAAELLLERIDDPAREPRVVGVEPRLVVRASSGGARERRPRARAACFRRPARTRSQSGVGLSGREALLLLIPALLPVVILSVLPLARGIYLGFTDSRAGLSVDTNFIGLDNFRALIHDDLFVNSFKIGLIWAVAVTAIQFCSRSASRCCSASRCAGAGSPARSRSCRGRCRR